MHPDKIIIAIAIAFVALGLNFKETVFKEIDVFLLYEKFEEQSERVSEAFNYPLTQKERADLIQNYVETLTLAQNKISKTIIVKHFIDYTQVIASLEEYLFDRYNDMDDQKEIVSFETKNNHEIVADPLFSKKSLLQLGSIIDDTFPEELGTASFIVCAQGDITLHIVPDKISDYFYRIDANALSSRLSKEAFEGNTITISIEPPNDKCRTKESLNSLLLS